MPLVIRARHPSRVYLESFSEKDLEAARSFLTYHDRSADFQYKKFRHARWFLNKYGDEAFQEELAKRKAAIKQCILQQEDGEHYTYSGLASYLHERFKEHEVESRVAYPEPHPIPWKNLPPPLRDYQAESIGLLLESRHAAVELSTGLGKSLIIFNLLRGLGLKTVVMAPLESIASQLYRELVHLLGEKYVGFYGSGKHVSKKLITVGIHASLTRIEPESKAWEELSEAEVLICDESHMTPASSLEKVCMGICAKAPYRFFLSATQLRGDGAELVLKGITGPIVKSVDFKQGVDMGYLARPHFRMVKVASNSTLYPEDSNAMTREHLYYNPAVNKKAAQIANMAVKNGLGPVLILVQEVEQFTMLLPHLLHKTAFAHGGLTKDNKGKVPVAYHDSDATELVKQFNAGEIPILVGTSCVSMGVDIRPVRTLIYLQGLSSEVKCKQSVGRGTRMPPGKTEFFLFDFMVETMWDQDEPTTPPCRHALDRLAYYRDLYPDVGVVN